MADIQSLNAKRANAAGDSSKLLPLESLIDAENDIRTGDVKPNKSVVILLRNDESGYAFRSYYAGMKASEIVALLDTVKHRLLHQINED